MVFALLRASLVTFGIAFALVSGCGGGDGGGPPISPCTEQSKSHPPYCGSTCKARCGCQQCLDGSQWTLDGQSYVCEGGCLKTSLVSGGGGSAGSGGTAGAAQGGNAGVSGATTGGIGGSGGTMTSDGG